MARDSGFDSDAIMAPGMFNFSLKLFVSRKAV